MTGSRALEKSPSLSAFAHGTALGEVVGFDVCEQNVSKFVEAGGRRVKSLPRRFARAHATLGASLAKP